MSRFKYQLPTACALLRCHLAHFSVSRITFVALAHNIADFSTNCTNALLSDVRCIPGCCDEVGLGLVESTAMDPLSAFINDDYPITTHQQQTQHSDRQKAAKQAAAGGAVADAGFRMAFDNTLNIAAAETAVIGPSETLDMNPADDADPVSSPRAASPYQPTTPMDVPRSNGSSNNGTTAAAQAAQHQALLHAGAEVSTPSRNVQDSRGMPPLSPPDPDLNPELLEQLLQKASPAITDNRFSMSDFLKNKSAMTAAARRELAGGTDHTLHGPAVGADDITTSLEGEFLLARAQVCHRACAHILQQTQSLALACVVSNAADRAPQVRTWLLCVLPCLRCATDAPTQLTLCASQHAQL
jgi:hypothetical protein